MRPLARLDVVLCAAVVPPATAFAVATVFAVVLNKPLPHEVEGFIAIGYMAWIFAMAWVIGWALWPLGKTFAILAGPVGAIAVSWAILYVLTRAACVLGMECDPFN